jgi:elongation factor Ts
MAISSAQVRELREMTGIGMMTCKQALEESGGDMKKAVGSLRKQGQVTAAKRAGRVAKEGKVTVLVADGMALVYEVNSETDFVAANEDFLKFTQDLGSVLMSAKPVSLQAALALSAPAFGGRTVADRVTELVGKIGENIGLRRFALVNVDKARERIFSYVHGNGRIGVVVRMSSANAAALASDAASGLGKDLAMQVAASNPIAVDRTKISAEVIAKEREIYMSQAQASGRPDKVWEKIVEGKLAKFYQESALVEQPYIREPGITVADRIKQAEKEAGAALVVESFVRYELGVGE